MKILDAKKEFIMEEDRDFESGHASTIIQLKNGEIICAWFGGSFEKGPDVAIWFSRRSIDGVWCKPYIIADTRSIALWNPVLFQRPDGRILLFYKEGEIIEKWRTLLIFSEDYGVNFSKPKELVDGDIGGRGPVKNKPILLSDGSILAPASFEGDTWDSFTDKSVDGGQTWEMSSFVPVRRLGYTDADKRANDKRHCYGKGLIQPTLWESKPGHIHMLMRSTSSAIFRSDSIDFGMTWSVAYQSGLPNNNSGLDLVKLQNGNLILCLNPVGNLPNYYKGPRTPLVILHSSDNGETWDKLHTLEQGIGSFAYPAIIANENEIFISYTWNRERIVFWKLTYEI